MYLSPRYGKGWNCRIRRCNGTRGRSHKEKAANPLHVGRRLSGREVRRNRTDGTKLAEDRRGARP